MDYRTVSPSGETVRVAISHSAIEIVLEDGRRIVLNVRTLLALLRQKLGISL